ncbi:MAG: ABC transporter permease [Oligoflexales bacterium]
MSLYALISSFELGLVFGIMAIGVYLTFRVLNFPDLSVDGTLPLGAAVSSVAILNGINPWLALLAAFIAGACAGLVTALLNVRLGIMSLLASIVTMTALYSINLRIMGRPNLALLGEQTVFTHFEAICPAFLQSNLIVLIFYILVLSLLGLILYFFLATELGLALRATGNNPQMARAMGISTDNMTLLGVSLSNALAALAGGLYSQAQGSADIGMGIGTIVAGLVSVIIGEAMIRKKGVAWALLGALVGSCLYRVAIGFALAAGTGDSFFALKASDLNLITAIIVVLLLAGPKLKLTGKRSLR